MALLDFDCSEVPQWVMAAAQAVFQTGRGIDPRVPAQSPAAMDFAVLVAKQDRA